MHSSSDVRSRVGNNKGVGYTCIRVTGVMNNCARDAGARITGVDKDIKETRARVTGVSNNCASVTSARITGVGKGVGIHVPG